MTKKHLATAWLYFLLGSLIGIVFTKIDYLLVLSSADPTAILVMIVLILSVLMTWWAVLELT